MTNLKELGFEWLLYQKYATTKVTTDPQAIKSFFDFVRLHKP